jgi:hypothetical protein
MRLKKEVIDMEEIIDIFNDISNFVLKAVY